MKPRTAFMVGCSLTVAVAGGLAVGARTVEHPPSWEFTHCGAPPKTLTFNERLICSDRDLRQLDRALFTAYRAKETLLSPAQTDALRHDDIEWQVRTCRDITGRHASTDIVRKCLSDALRLRQQFVEALPVDRADVPYRLSHFERLLLQNYAGSPPGVVNMMISGGDDAVRAGLRRVFTAIMPGEAKQDIAVSAPHTASDFIENAFGDGATLEGDRYFVDFGAKIHEGSRQGMFVVDLETGDMTIASIDAYPSPVLYVWELACTPQSLKDFARGRFRREADQSAKDFASLVRDQPERIREYINSSSCT
jgi:hypothetical protein